MSYRLFDLPGLPADEPDPPGVSYTRRITLRNEALITQGFHPATRRRLLKVQAPGSDLRCKDCKHATRQLGNTRYYWKCLKNPRGLTKGLATDLRLKWPACELLDEVVPSRDVGSVVGRVQTLQGRGRLRFTIYDLLYDRAVSCYLQQGQEEVMRGAWGRLVEVEGEVSRDPVTDAPISVRKVTRVTPFDDPSPGAWREARGAVTTPDAAEDIIRELRDGW